MSQAMGKNTVLLRNSVKLPKAAVDNRKQNGHLTRRPLLFTPPPALASVDRLLERAMMPDCFDTLDRAHNFRNSGVKGSNSMLKC